MINFKDLISNISEYGIIKDIMNYAGEEKSVYTLFRVYKNTKYSGGECPSMFYEIIQDAVSLCPDKLTNYVNKKHGKLIEELREDIIQDFYLETTEERNFVKKHRNDLHKIYEFLKKSRENQCWNLDIIDIHLCLNMNMLKNNEFIFFTEIQDDLREYIEDTDEYDLWSYEKEKSFFAGFVINKTKLI